MKCTELGVLETSNYYFSTPSSLAKRLYFYCICVGEFHCAVPYHTQRAHYNSFLLMQILEGRCLVKTNGQTLVGTQGDFILLNCYQSHEYYTDDTLHFRFIHFDGNVSEDFYSYIIKNNGHVFKSINPGSTNQFILQILEQYSKQPHIVESYISCILHQLLCTLLQSTPMPDSSTHYSLPIQNALDFIHQEYTRPLTLQNIAQQVNLSVYYFSHLFKKEIGYSPYEYLIYYRLERAKKLLKTTQKTVDEISFLTGFKGESNFIYCFHKNVGMSPGRFRKLPF